MSDCGGASIGMLIVAGIVAVVGGVEVIADVWRGNGWGLARVMAAVLAVPLLVALILAVAAATEIGK